MATSAVASEAIYSPQRDLQSFMNRFGDQIKVTWNHELGFPKNIVGIGAEMRLDRAPRTEGEFVAAAEELINSYPSLFGFDTGALVLDGSRRAPNTPHLEGSRTKCARRHVKAPRLIFDAARARRN